MKVLRALAAALLAAAMSGAALAQIDSSAPPLCEASVSLDPARAVPGQQVSYRLHLLVRSDVSDVAWEEPPSFPGLRAERLAGQSLPRPIERSGARYQLREEARALFAERPGRVLLPSARLGCRARGGLVASIATPESVLEVIPIPETDLPPALGGLVGPLALQSSVTPVSVSLGQSVRVAVTLRGDGNLWDAPEPELSPEHLEGAEVFQRPSELAFDRGTRLVVRRHFAIDIVPRREGVLRIPSLAWAYFDPVGGSAAEVMTEGVAVTVGPRTGARAERDPGPRERAASPAAEPAAPGAPLHFAVWVLAGLLLLGTIGAAGWRRRSRRVAVARAVRAALARADAARSAGDRDGELAGLACALRAAIGPELGAAARGHPEQTLASRRSPRARTAEELVARLERARFDPSAAPPDRAAVLQALHGLGSEARARAVERAAGEPGAG